MPAIVSLHIYTREIEPRLFYDSHNHHPWQLHGDISSIRLLQGTPQIKVSEWRSAGEQRDAVCRISTYKTPPSFQQVHSLPFICLFKHPRWGRCHRVGPHTRPLTAGIILRNLCRTTQLITTAGRTRGATWQMHAGKCVLSAETWLLRRESDAAWLCLIKNRSVHSGVTLMQDDSVNISFCRSEMWGSLWNNTTTIVDGGI